MWRSSVQLRVKALFASGDSYHVIKINKIPKLRKYDITLPGFKKNAFILLLIIYYYVCV